MFTAHAKINLLDERFLPVENSGTVSEWQLELPASLREGDRCQFDYNTISDVILQLRYTAREGGGLLRNDAVGDLKEPRGRSPLFHPPAC